MIKQSKEKGLTMAFLFFTANSAVPIMDTNTYERG